RREFFHNIFPAGTRLPRSGQPDLEQVASYSPRHNIGHLKFLECSDLGPDGLPRGQVRPWSDILFPYQLDVELDARLTTESIRPTTDLAATRVEERYQVDADGIITVEVRRLADGKCRRFEIYRD